MKAKAYIERTREYINYLEEHINNVHKAFCEVSEKCKDVLWVINIDKLKEDVIHHDLSKFSPQEFVQYRKTFFPVRESEKINSGMDEAWEHHKKENSHHHETVKTLTDVMHMVIDWTAMGYMFGDTAQQYYENNKDKISLSKSHKDFMYQIFDKLSV